MELIKNAKHDPISTRPSFEKKHRNMPTPCASCHMILAKASLSEHDYDARDSASSAGAFSLLLRSVSATNFAEMKAQRLGKA